MREAGSRGCQTGSSSSLIAEGGNARVESRCNLSSAQPQGFQYLPHCSKERGLVDTDTTLIEINLFCS